MLNNGQPSKAKLTYLERLIMPRLEWMLAWGLRKIHKRKITKRVFLGRKSRLLELEKISKNSSIGKWKFPTNRFSFDKPILLKETNIMGNTYYDNYLTWQGEARERLLLNHPSLEEWMRDNRHIKMITHSVHHQFLAETTFGDVVKIEVTSREIKRCSFILDFTFLNAMTHVVLGKGWQKICFVDMRVGRLCHVPQLILDLTLPIEDITPKALKSALI